MNRLKEASTPACRSSISEPFDRKLEKQHSKNHSSNGMRWPCEDDSQTKRRLNDDVPLPLAPELDRLNGGMT